MEKKMLFPKTGGLLHGGDYNPEQWLDRPDILEEDVRLMKKAGVNSVSMGIFSWSVYEPAEGDYHFDWLERIMDRLYENGIYTVLATPSGARPAWLDAAYPEAMRVSSRGVRDRHGNRHNHCMTSPVYRRKTEQINRRLAERFGSHPGLILWHISNEYGGECYCPLCAKRFQQYLADKFDHDIEKLNKAWWTVFWSHRYNSFDQIEPPYENGERSVMGLNLEWKRFTTWNTTDFMKAEIAVLKEITPDIPVTTNFMTLYDGLDYRRMAPELDVISWDSYPSFHNDGEPFFETMAENAFHHSVMRSMKKDKPFMLMESAPGLVNWQAFNKLKRPGVHKLACLQAVASGSDTVQYFQWRKSRGSAEQFHGAVVAHRGTEDTRVFREVAQVGEMLQKLRPVAGTTVKARTAILFDWDNRWAIRGMQGLGRETKRYEETCMGIWKEFLKMGVEMDVTAPDQDLSDYDVVIAPMLYMLKSETAANLRAFVEGGGQLLATYLTGYVDQDQLCFLGGFPGDGLAELFGVISEEIDTLYPSDRNHIRFEDGREWEVRDYAEVLQVQDARVLASYTEDFYQGMAAVTCKETGKGKAYYVAARTAPGQMAWLFEQMLKEAGISTRQLPAGVEYHVRSGEEGTYEFYLNHNTHPVKVENVQGPDLESGAVVQGDLELAGLCTAVIRLQGTD